MTQQVAEHEDDHRITNGPVAHLRTLVRELPQTDQSALVRELRRFLYRQTFERPPGAEPTVAVARFPGGGIVPADVRWLVEALEAGELALHPASAPSGELYLHIGRAAPPTDTYFVDAGDEVLEEFLSAQFVPQQVATTYEKRSGRALARP